MKSWSRLAAVLVVSLAALVPTAILAAPSKNLTGVALMPFDTPQDDAAVGRQILAAVRDAVATTAGFTEKGPVEMRLDEARMAFSCFDEKPGCMSQVGALVDAKLLLWGKLQHDGTTLRLEVHLVDVGKASSRDDVLSETGSGAVDRLGRRAAEFVVGKRAEPGAPVSVRSSPIGATVDIDGTARGRTPLELVLSPGVHVAEIRMDGMQSRRESFEVVDGLTTPVVIEETLSPLVRTVGRGDDTHAERPSGPGTRFWLGIGSAGVAAAAVGSATIFAMKTTSIKDDYNKNGGASRHDSMQHDFERARLVTNISWGVAAAAAGASVYFFLTQDEGTSDATSFHVSPTPDGVGVGGVF